MNIDLLTDLYYPSESDEPIEWVTFEQDFVAPLSDENIRTLLNVPSPTEVDIIDEDTFWRPITTVEDWFDDYQTEQVARFKNVATEVQNILVNRQVIKVGTTEIDLLLLGQTADGCWAGLKTKLIET